MSLDFSELTIGAPGMVIDGLTGRVGQLNFSSLNIKTGVTAHPDATWRRLRQNQPWMVMKLLYATNSFAHARQMADLLRAWDGKLFVDEPDGLGGDLHDSTFYAYAVIR